MSSKDNSATAQGVAGVSVSADVIHMQPNQIKVKIVFSGNNRESSVDLDSKTGCKCAISGPLYPEDMALVTAIMKLVNDAKATYPPGP